MSGGISRAPTQRRSEGEEAQEEAGEKPSSSDYVWHSRGPHLCISICMMLDPLIFCTELPKHLLAGSSDIAYCFSLFITVIPVIFMQIFIGQYTRLGCLHYGKMIPLMHGVGVAKLIINFLTILCVSEIAGITGEQLYTTLNEPWSSCNPEWEGCITLNDLLQCHDPICSNTTYHNLSSRIYFSRNDDLQTSTKILSIILFSILTFVFVWLGFEVFYHLLYVSILAALITTAIILGLSSVFSSKLSVDFLYVRKKTMSVSSTTVQGLINTISRPLIATCVAGGGHIIYGTRLSTRILPSIQALLIALTFILCIGLGALLFRVCYYSFITNIHWNEDLQESVSEKEMVVVIMEGFLHTHFLNYVYPAAFNASCALLVLSKMIVHTDIIKESIINYYSSLEKHKVYIIITIIIVNSMCIIPYLAMISIFEENLRTFVEYASLIILEIEVIMVLYIYSYTLLSDDIHFVFASQPAKIWKVLWLLAPVIQAVGLLLFNKTITLVILILVLIVLLPILAGAFYKMYKNIQQNNVLGVFMPEDVWGMRSLYLRKLRHMYNPREETHTQKRAEQCNHDCLLDSTVLHSLVREEIELNQISKMDQKVDELYGEQRRVSFKGKHSEEKD